MHGISSIFHFHPILFYPPTLFRGLRHLALCTNLVDKPWRFCITNRQKHILKGTIKCHKIINKENIKLSNHWSAKLQMKTQSKWKHAWFQSGILDSFSWSIKSSWFRVKTNKPNVQYVWVYVGWVDNSAAYRACYVTLWEATPLHGIGFATAGLPWHF